MICMCKKNPSTLSHNGVDKHLGAPLFYYTAENRIWHQNLHYKATEENPKQSFNPKSQNLISKQYANQTLLAFQGTVV